MQIPSLNLQSHKIFQHPLTKTVTLNLQSTFLQRQENIKQPNPRNANHFYSTFTLIYNTHITILAFVIILFLHKSKKNYQLRNNDASVSQYLTTSNHCLNLRINQHQCHMTNPYQYLILINQCFITNQHRCSI